jgi:hypothetical protein
MSDESLTIPDMIRETLRDPRAAAKRIMAMDLEAGTLWQGLALVVVLSVIAAQVTALLSGAPAGGGAEIMLPAVLSSPLLMGFVQGALLVLMVFAVYWIGRTFGGGGRFEDSIALVTWLQFLLVCLQVVQGVATLILPPLAGLIGIAGLVLFFWLLTQFVTVMHGFDSPGMVFAMIVVSMLAIVFALSMVLALIGVLFVGEPPDV